ncbi:MAG: sulfotransferase [Bacteroidota bacterium]
METSTHAPASGAPAPSPEAPIPVIYVIGSGRSGSTLLGQLLGGHPEVFYAGEVYNYRNSHLHARAGRDRWCSCGKSVEDCDFWTTIRQRLAEDWDDPLLDLKDRDPATFEAHNAALFRALLVESGRSVIVDASKRHYRLDLMLKSDAFEVTIVHLVRDARAYGQSILKTRVKANRPPRAYYTKMWNWQRKNLAMKAIYGRQPTYDLVRYEELAADPAGVVARILGHVGLTPAPDQLDRAQHEYHDFSGNLRARLKNVRPVALQTGYLDKLNARRWALGTAMVAPGLRAFGYPLGREATREHLDALRACGANGAPARGHE